jgi:uncharacterized protein (DUF58 family)
MAHAGLTAEWLPAPAELQAFAHVAARLLTEQRPGTPGQRTVRRRAGPGTQPLDHREYVLGDDVRHIDWRLTARRQRPVVRRFEAESSGDWILLLDASSSLAVHGARKWRAAATGVAVLSYALLGLGHRVGVMTFGAGVRAECRPGRGHAQYARIVRLLGEAPPSSGETSDLGACAQRLRGDASVVVVSDFLAEDELRGGLAAVLARCTMLQALQVQDPDDAWLAAVAGDVELVDIETGRGRAVRADTGLAALAASEHAAMTARLRRFCARAGAAHSAWNVGRPWREALIEHLARARQSC